MRATLIVNPNAGGINGVTPDMLLDALAEAGYDAEHPKTESESDLDTILAEADGLVVVAGGDGTVRAAATRMIEGDLPLSVIPLGTANNIGQMLGVTGSPEEVIAGLREPQRRHFDVGRVRFPWGTEYFLEAFGYGFYAEVLAAYNPEEGKSVLRSLGAINETLKNYQPHACQILLDGEDITNKYLLFEVLNTTAFGPRLRMAPHADPSDGLFDVIRIQEDERENFFSYMMSLLREDLEELPNVAVSRGRKVEICWDGFFCHVDGLVRPALATEGGANAKSGESADGSTSESSSTETPILTVEIIPSALEFWLPRPQQA